MNYNWDLISNKGDYPHGFVEVFKTEIKGKNAIAIINYLAQLGDNDQKVVTTVLLEGDKNSWTENVTNSILHDAEDRIKSA